MCYTKGRLFSETELRTNMIVAEGEEVGWTGGPVFVFIDSLTTSTKFHCPNG